MSKINNQSYFIKRLKDSGYVVYKIFDDYNTSDPRKWTILIDPKVSAVYITLFEDAGRFGDEDYFEFNDGGRYVPKNFKLKTDSMEVVINHIVNFNINNKVDGYNTLE